MLVQDTLRLIGLDLDVSDAASVLFVSRREIDTPFGFIGRIDYGQLRMSLVPAKLSLRRVDESFFYPTHSCLLLPARR